MGKSSGGGIAAGAALLARDRCLSPPLEKQFLIYPMLDDRTSAKLNPEDPIISFLDWTPALNKFAWDAYLGADKAGNPAADVSPYAAPVRAQDLADLPSTYIDVGGLDLFCHEDIAYAAKLYAAGVEVEFHMRPGLPHGFDVFSGVVSVEVARKNLCRAVKVANIKANG